MSIFSLGGIEPPLRDLRMTMDAPFFSLEKKRTHPIKYVGRNGYVSVTPAADNHIATNLDAEIMIGFYSLLNDAKNRGTQFGSKVSFRPGPFLRCIGRRTSGKDYIRLAQGIRRLQTTTITTSFALCDDFQTDVPFSWISDYQIPDHVLGPSGARTRIYKPWIVELPAWVPSLFQTHRYILGIHPDYFLLKSATARALYRTARKCVSSTKKRWTYRADTLHKRYALRSPLSRFVRKVCEIADRDILPEYAIDVISDGLQVSITFREKPYVQLSPIRGVFHHKRKPKIIGGGKL